MDEESRALLKFFRTETDMIRACSIEVGIFGQSMQSSHIAHEEITLERKEIADGTDRETGSSKQISFQARTQTDRKRTGGVVPASNDRSFHWDGGCFDGHNQSINRTKGVRQNEETPSTASTTAYEALSMLCTLSYPGRRMTPIPLSYPVEEENPYGFVIVVYCIRLWKMLVGEGWSLLLCVMRWRKRAQRISRVCSV